jgi:CRISPR system Cascade subunit CasA
MSTESLLTAPVVPICSPTGEWLQVSLSSLFARWSQGLADEVQDMRAHQAPAVESALALFAAHALEVAGRAFGPHTEDEWAKMLQDLAVQQGAPQFWDLAGTDVGTAAFMQPALLVPALAKKLVASPAELDVLVASKNHDIKQDELLQPAPWHWVCALITGQTCAGYGGKSLYGVMRMNSGTGVRTFLAGYNDDTPFGRWSEDVTRLLRLWKRLHEDNSFGFRPDGVRLVAAVPWDGSSPLSLSDLHPGAVEIARPTRLSYAADGKLTAHTGGTQVTRIAASEQRGNVADAWTALARDDKGVKALSSGDRSFTWQNFVSALFSPETALLSELSRDVDTSREVTQRFRAVSRSQQGTHGYQDFSFTFPAKVARRLFGPAAPVTERQALLSRQKAAVEVAGRIASRASWAYGKALAPLDADNDAISKLLKRDHHVKVVAQLRGRLAHRWQHAMLPWLCASVLDELSDPQALENWFSLCRQHAAQELKQLLAPRPGALRANVFTLAKGLNVLPASLAQLDV